MKRAHVHEAQAAPQPTPAQGLLRPKTPTQGLLRPQMSPPAAYSRAGAGGEAVARPARKHASASQPVRRALLTP